MARPDDPALVNRGFELDILEDRKAEKAQKVRLVLHMGNFPDVWIYGVNNESVTTEAYIRLDHIISYQALFAGFVAAAICYALARALTASMVNRATNEW